MKCPFKPFKRRLQSVRRKISKAKENGPNQAFIVWGTCYLWVISLFAIVWALALFFCIPDFLAVLKMDLINGLVLLSGLIMLPANVYLLYNIAHGIKLDHKGKVVCCPLWVCMGWVIVVTLVGAGLCIRRIYDCRKLLFNVLTDGLQQYRHTAIYRRFMDTLQCTMKCCGKQTYKDWFTSNWYDKESDYGLDPTINMRYHSSFVKSPTIDSVPLSCCKTGSCVSNFLTEMGTDSINTDGCAKKTVRVALIALTAHLFFFVSVVFVEILLIICMMDQCKATKTKRRTSYDVRHIMSVKHTFDASSCSYQQDSDDSEDLECMKQVEEHRQTE